MNMPVFTRLKTDDLTTKSGDIVEYLQGLEGSSLAAEQIAKRFAMSTAAMRYILAQMEADGMIRKVSGVKSPRFYIATNGQLEAERRLADQGKREFRPLKIERRRAELYEQLQRERSQYHSLYGDKPV